MTIIDLIFLSILVCTFILGLGIVLIKEDIEKLKELIKENKYYDTRTKSKSL